MSYSFPIHRLWPTSRIIQEQRSGGSPGILHGLAAPGPLFPAQFNLPDSSVPGRFQGRVCRDGTVVVRKDEPPSGQQESRAILAVTHMEDSSVRPVVFGEHARVRPLAAGPLVICVSLPLGDRCRMADLGSVAQRLAPCLRLGVADQGEVWIGGPLLGCKKAARTDTAAE